MTSIIGSGTAAGSVSDQDVVLVDGNNLDKSLIFGTNSNENVSIETSDIIRLTIDKDTGTTTFNGDVQINGTLVTSVPPLSGSTDVVQIFPSIRFNESNILEVTYSNNGKRAQSLNSERTGNTITNLPFALGNISNIKYLIESDYSNHRYRLGVVSETFNVESDQLLQGVNSSFFESKNGIPVNSVFQIYYDTQNNLTVTLDSGAGPILLSQFPVTITGNFLFVMAQYFSFPPEPWQFSIIESVIGDQEKDAKIEIQTPYINSLDIGTQINIDTYNNKTTFSGEVEIPELNVGNLTGTGIINYNDQIITGIGTMSLGVVDDEISVIGNMTAKNLLTTEKDYNLSNTIIYEQVADTVNIGPVPNVNITSDNIILQAPTLDIGNVSTADNVTIISNDLKINSLNQGITTLGGSGLNLNSDDLISIEGQRVELLGTKVSVTQTQVDINDNIQNINFKQSDKFSVDNTLQLNGGGAGIDDINKVVEWDENSGFTVQQKGGYLTLNPTTQLSNDQQTATGFSNLGALGTSTNFIWNTNELESNGFKYTMRSKLTIPTNVSYESRMGVTETNWNWTNIPSNGLWSTFTVDPSKYDLVNTGVDLYIEMFRNSNNILTVNTFVNGVQQSNAGSFEIKENTNYRFFYQSQASGYDTCVYDFIETQTTGNISRGGNSPAFATTLPLNLNKNYNFKCKLNEPLTPGVTNVCYFGLSLAGGLTNAIVLDLVAGQLNHVVNFITVSSTPITTGNTFIDPDTYMEMSMVERYCKVSINGKDVELPDNFTLRFDETDQVVFTLAGGTFDLNLLQDITSKSLVFQNPSSVLINEELNVYDRDGHELLTLSQSKIKIGNVDTNLEVVSNLNVLEDIACDKTITCQTSNSDNFTATTSMKTPALITNVITSELDNDLSINRNDDGGIPDITFKKQIIELNKPLAGTIPNDLLWVAGGMTVATVTIDDEIQIVEVSEPVTETTLGNQFLGMFDGFSPDNDFNIEIEIDNTIGDVKSRVVNEFGLGSSPTVPDYNLSNDVTVLFPGGYGAVASKSYATEYTTDWKYKAIMDNWEYRVSGVYKLRMVYRQRVLTFSLSRIDSQVYPYKFIVEYTVPESVTDNLYIFAARPRYIFKTQVYESPVYTGGPQGVVIDGYNVMNELDRLQTLGPDSVMDTLNFIASDNVKKFQIPFQTDVANTLVNEFPSWDISTEFTLSGQYNTGVQMILLQGEEKDLFSNFTFDREDRSVREWVSDYTIVPELETTNLPIRFTVGVCIESFTYGDLLQQNSITRYIADNIDINELSGTFKILMDSDNAVRIYRNDVYIAGGYNDAVNTFTEQRLKFFIRTRAQQGTSTVSMKALRGIANIPIVLNKTDAFKSITHTRPQGPYPDFNPITRNYTFKIKINDIDDSSIVDSFIRFTTGNEAERLNYTRGWVLDIKRATGGLQLRTKYNFLDEQTYTWPNITSFEKGDEFLFTTVRGSEIEDGEDAGGIGRFYYNGQPIPITWGCGFDNGLSNFMRIGGDGVDLEIQYDSVDPSIIFNNSDSFNSGNQIEFGESLTIQSDAATYLTLENDLTTIGSRMNILRNLEVNSINDIIYVNDPKDFGFLESTFIVPIYLLNDNTCYVITKPITLKNSIRLGSNCSITGYKGISSITFDESERDCDITASGVDVFITNISIIGGGGRFTGTTQGLFNASNFNVSSPPPFYGRNKRFLLLNCDLIKVFKMGIVKGYATININNSIFNGGGGDSTLWYEVLSLGNGYSIQQNVALIGGTGIGATVDITSISGTQITGLLMNQRGSGYTLKDNLTVTGGGHIILINSVDSNGGIGGAYTREGLKVTGGLSLEFNNNKVVLFEGAQNSQADGSLLTFDDNQDPVLGFNAVNVSGNIIHPRSLESGLRFNDLSTTASGIISGNTFLRSGGQGDLISYGLPNILSKNNYNFLPIFDYQITGNSEVPSSEPSGIVGFSGNTVETIISNIGDYVDILTADNVKHATFYANVDNCKIGKYTEVTNVVGAPFSVTDIKVGDILSNLAGDKSFSVIGITETTPIQTGFLALYTADDLGAEFNDNESIYINGNPQAECGKVVPFNSDVAPRDRLQVYFGSIVSGRAYISAHVVTESETNDKVLGAKIFVNGLPVESSFTTANVRSNQKPVALDCSTIITLSYGDIVTVKIAGLEDLSNQTITSARIIIDL